MQQYRSDIVRVTEANSINNLSDRFTNEIYYSNVNVGYVHAYRSNFSIKYVIEGAENYIVGKTRVNLKKGQYIIVNNDQSVECLNSNAKAMSFFLNRDILDDIVDNIDFNDGYLLDNPIDKKNRNINFFENVYSENDALGLYLKSFYKQVISTNHFNLNEESFYNIGLNLIASQLNIFDEINSLANAKFSTRKELYRRVLIAKLYIEGISIEDEFNLDLLCKSCHLSKYHLIRTFKAVYKTTPYNYYINLKIQGSAELLKNTNLSITEIAEISGFNDIHTYYKRFKKIMAISPSEFRIRNLND